ncbi:MAG TPA: amidohydrolase family protein, partial [Candidatus Ozemobacteraceae bacterium]|nr:amidohydrolase family protein [Candidatus Ozemobacteraceae bacterium]
MTVFYNCVGHDLPDYAKKSFDSFVVHDGRIDELGWELHTFSRFSHATKVDLGGRDVFPAFADAHTHFLQTGLMLSGCDLSSARSISDVLAQLDEFARSCSDSWLLAWNLDETLLKENRLPTVNELDRVIPRHKAWFSRIDLHSAVPNSATMRWAAEKHGSAPLENGRYVKRTYEI